jgi:hypothetical protein
MSNTVNIIARVCLNVAEAALALGCSTKTIRRLLADKRLPYSRLKTSRGKGRVVIKLDRLRLRGLSGANGRVGWCGRSAPTSTRAASAPGRALARAIDINERDGVALDAGDVLLPRCHRNELAVRARSNAERSGLDRDAWRWRRGPVGSPADDLPRHRCPTLLGAQDSAMSSTRSKRPICRPSSALCTGSRMRPMPRPPAPLHHGQAAYGKFCRGRNRAALA